MLFVAISTQKQTRDSWQMLRERWRRERDADRWRERDAEKEMETRER